MKPTFFVGNTITGATSYGDVTDAQMALTPQTFERVPPFDYGYIEFSFPPVPAGAVLCLLWHESGYGVSTVPLTEGATYAYVDTPMLGGVGRSLVYAAVTTAVVIPRCVSGSFTVPRFGVRSSFSTNRSQSGQFLGRSVVRQGVHSVLDFDRLPEDFVRGPAFQSLVRGVVDRPFFYSWDPEGHPGDIAFLWTDEDVNPVYEGGRSRMLFSLNVTGVVPND